VITEGCTKIEAPMMVPTTIAVACGRPMTRLSSGAAVLHSQYTSGLHQRQEFIWAAKSRQIFQARFFFLIFGIFCHKWCLLY
jgi:hypothetical protein